MFIYNEYGDPMHDIDLSEFIFTSVFAVRRKQRGIYGDLLEVFIEDDGNYFRKMSFDIGWLPSFQELLQKIKD